MERDGRPPFGRAAAGQGRVSVVIPLHDHAAYVEEAVRSALGQGAILRELIVVDDGSRDGSAEVMHRLAGADPRIVFWSQPNRGAHAALNSGLHRATGELLAILNSDDAYLPGRLDRLAAALDADPGAGLAASDLVFMDARGEPAVNAWYAQAVRFFESTRDLALSLVNGNVLMTTSNYLIRRELLEQVGGFAPLRYTHDVDYALRLLAGGRRIAWVREPLLRYRMHDSNTISENHDRVRLEWAAAAAFFLHLVWDRPGGQRIDWARAAAFAEVLERHRLTGAVQLLRTWFLQHPGETMEHGAVLRDAEFISHLQRAVRVPG
jgi:glycosyltransferase involved in cell wall biosynthesis